MANCVLCGQKLGMFDKVKIDFHNTKQSVCSDCANRLDNTVGPDGRSCSAKFWIPLFGNGEDIRADINTGKPCPACGAILHRKLRNFSIGSDGYGGLSSLGLPSYEVDLYACPQCGKVELYTAAPGAWAALTDQPEAEQVTCPTADPPQPPDWLSQLRCASGWSGRTFPQEEKQSTSKRSKKVPGRSDYPFSRFNTV